MKNLILITIFNLAITIAANAQSAHSLLRKGDKEYETQKYNVAEENYRKALEKESSGQGNYNLGNAIYSQERYDEALNRFELAINTAKDETAKAFAYHNLGNTLYNQKEYEKSIDAYKSALRLSPNDIETKKNLAIAQRQLRIQQQQQKQNQQNQENKKNKEKEENQQPEQQDQQPQQEQEQNLTKEEARKLLEIMEQEEQKVQQKLKKAQTKPNRSAKDW